MLGVRSPPVWVLDVLAQPGTEPPCKGAMDGIPGAVHPSALLPKAVTWDATAEAAVDFVGQWVEQHALHAMPSSSLREAVYAADAAAGALTSLQPRGTNGSAGLIYKQFSYPPPSSRASYDNSIGCARPFSGFDDDEACGPAPIIMRMSVKASLPAEACSVVPGLGEERQHLEVQQDPAPRVRQLFMAQPVPLSTSGTTSVPGSSPLISQDLSNPFLLAVLPTVAAFVRPLPRTSNPHSAVSAQHCGGSPLGSATHVKPGTQVVGCHGTCPLTGDTQSTVLMPGSSSEAECPVPFSPSPPPGTAGAPVAQHRGRDKGQSWAAPQHQGGLPPLVPGSCMPPLAVICASTAATAARGGPSGGVARAHDSADDLVAWFSIQAHAAAPALPLQPAVMQPPTINSSTPVISPASANPDKQCFRPSEGGFLATLQDGIASGVFSAAGKACESNTAATCSLRVSLAGSPNIQVPPTTAFGSRVPHETGSSAQPASAWAHQQPEWGGLFTVFAQPQPFTVDSGRTQSQHPEGDRTSPADRSMKQLSGTLEEAQHLDHTLLSRLLSETPSSPGRWPVVKQWPDHQKGWEQAAAVAGVRPSAWGECPTQPGYGCCIPPGGFSSSSGATSVGPPPPPIYHHQQQKRMTADCAIVAPKGSNTPLDLLCHLSRPVHDTAVGTAHHDGAPPDSVAARISSPAYMGPSKPHLSFSHQHQQAQPRLAFHVHRLMRHVTYSDGQLGSARRGLRAGSACGAAVPAIQHPLSGAQGAGGHTRICRSHSQWSETLGSLLLPVYSAATPPDWPDTPNTSYTGAAL